jgi:hypothetical protein
MYSGNNRYLDNKQMFQEPMVTQVGGSHMVMTDVMCPIKKQYVNIDTRIREDYSSSLTTQTTIDLPQRITKVKSMRLINAEIPFSFFNICTSLQNSSIVFTDNVGTRTVYTFDDNFYYFNSLASYFSGHSLPATMAFSFVNNNKNAQFTFTPAGPITSMTMELAVDTLGNFDKLNFKGKVGWMLGFRTATFTFDSGALTYTAEALVNVSGPRYVYVGVDDFSMYESSMVTPLYHSLINKNILARVNLAAVNPISFYEFEEDIFMASVESGTIVTDTRLYPNGKTDIYRLRVCLIDEFGRYIDLNGCDFSFCLELTYE